VLILFLFVVTGYLLRVGEMLQGVTIPSQRRYVQYYGHLIRNGLDYSPKTVLLKAIRLEGVPNFTQGTCCEYMYMMHTHTHTYTHDAHTHTHKGDIRIIIQFLGLRHYL